MELENSEPAEQRLSTVSLEQTSQPQQKRVAAMFMDNSRDAYTKLMRTAYELALNPTLPMRQFKTLVKVQMQNGVRLIEGANLISYFHGLEAVQIRTRLCSVRPKWRYTVHIRAHINSYLDDFQAVFKSYMEDYHQIKGLMIYLYNLSLLFYYHLPLCSYLFLSQGYVNKSLFYFL